MRPREIAELKRMQQRELERNTRNMNLIIAKIMRKERLKRIAAETEASKNNPSNLDESGASKTSINQLSHDCLAKIFSYLPPQRRLRMEKVCTKWEEAVQMSWYNVKKLDSENLFKILFKNKEEILRNLLTKCCQYLTHLTIHQQFPWLRNILENNCKNIVNLNINLSSDNSHLLFNIIASMTKLKSIKAKVYKRGCRTFCTRLFRELPVDMEEIHLEAIDYNFEQLPQNAPVLNKFINLRCLTLQNFRLTNAIIKSILRKKNTLVYLDLNGCQFLNEYPKIFSSLVYLEHLNLGKVKNLDGREFIEVAHNCPELKYLEYSSDDFRREYFILHGKFCELKYLKNLEHLDFPAVDKPDDPGVCLISDVVNNCKKLKHLNVGRGKNFLTSDLKEIKKLKDLKFVGLSKAKEHPLVFDLPSDVREKRDGLMAERLMCERACKQQ